MATRDRPQDPTEPSSEDEGGVRKPGAGLASDRAKRAQRRDRDALAERRAVQAILAIFFGFGGMGFLALNLSGLGLGGTSEQGDTKSKEKRRGTATIDKASSSASSGLAASGSPASEAVSGGLGGAGSSATRVVPAPSHMEALRHTGLTIGTEGVPQSEANFPRARAAVGLQACRFAYGVWEFSPNQTFRFLSTCSGLGRLELVGGYQLRDEQIYLSELVVGNTRWTSVFQLAAPSTMRSLVRLDQTRTIALKQRVTVAQEGLHGDEFRQDLRSKNLLTVPGPERPARPPKSALQELLGD